MKKNNYVRFVRNIPVKLAKAKTPIVGTVVSLIGKESVVVKPKGRRFTVVMNITDLVKITSKEFGKKQKNPNTANALRNLKKAEAAKEQLKKETVAPVLESAPKPFCKDPEVSEQIKPKSIPMNGACVTVKPKVNIMEEYDEEIEQDSGSVTMYIVIAAGLLILTVAIGFFCFG